MARSGRRETTFSVFDCQINMRELVANCLLIVDATVRVKAATSHVRRPMSGKTSTPQAWRTHRTRRIIVIAVLNEITIRTQQIQVLKDLRGRVKWRIVEKIRARHWHTQTDTFGCHLYVFSFPSFYYIALEITFELNKGSGHTEEVTFTRSFIYTHLSQALATN